MSFQLLLNILIALVWMALNNDWSVSGLMIGFIVGVLFIFALRRFFPEEFYMNQLWSIIKLLWLFIVELVLSNFAVIGHVLRPKLNIRPGIVAVHTDLKTDWEITLLACLITLTPGTLTIEVSQDQRVLYIHAMNIRDAEVLVSTIKNRFEKAILEVTR